MSIDLFINELSFSNTTFLSRFEAEEALSDFGRILATIPSIDSLVLGYSEKLWASFLFEDFNLSNWVSSPGNRDAKSYVLSTLDRGKHIDSEETLTCKIDNIEAFGFLHAYIRMGISVSLLSSPVWSAINIVGNFDQLDDSGNILHFQSELKNISNKDHVQASAAYLEPDIFECVKNVSTRLEKFRTYFPSLILCPAVETQIIGIDDAIKLRKTVQIFERIHSYVNPWPTPSFNRQKLAEKGVIIDPESEERIAYQIEV